MKIIALFIGLLLCSTLPAQQQTDFSFTTVAVRDSIKTALVKLVDETIALPFQSNESKWTGACWAMEIMLYQPKYFEARIPALIKQLSQQTYHLQYAFVEMLYTVYPHQFAKPIQQQWKLLANAKVKALALEYLKRNNISVKDFTVQLP